MRRTVKCKACANNKTRGLLTGNTIKMENSNRQYHGYSVPTPYPPRARPVLKNKPKPRRKTPSPLVAATEKQMTKFKKNLKKNASEMARRVNIQTNETNRMLAKFIKTQINIANKAMKRK